MKMFILKENQVLSYDIHVSRTKFSLRNAVLVHTGVPSRLFLLVVSAGTRDLLVLQ